MIFYGNTFNSYKNQLILSLASQGITLLLIPIITIYFKNIFGFIINCLIVMSMGFGNALLLKTIYSIAPYLPKKYIIAMSIGQAVSGIIINILRFIVSAVIGEINDNNDQEKNEGIYQDTAVTFFGISVLLIVINIILVYVSKFL